MKRSLRNSILLLLTAMLLTVSALADSGPKAQLTVKVENAPSEPYYLDLLEKGDYQGHTYGSGDGDDTYSGLDWSYSEEEIAALLTEEQISAASEHYAALAPASEETAEESGEPAYIPAVNFTNVAPMLDPVKGAAPRKLARAAAKN